MIKNVSVIFFRLTSIHKLYFLCSKIIFSCSNETLQRLFTSQDNIKNISTLNIVLNTEERVKTSLSKQNFVKDVWVFIINETRLGDVRQPIREYFTDFSKLSLKSTVYSLVITDGKQLLFEVYRATPYSQLTMTLICQLDSQSQKIEFLNKKPIYERRTNLTGVHLRVGVMMDNVLISSDTKVNHLY